MRRLFGCPDIVSLTEKFLMARNFYRIFTENNPVMGDSKTFGIPEAKGLKTKTKNPLNIQKHPHIAKNLISQAFQCVIQACETSAFPRISTSISNFTILQVLLS